VSGHAGTVEEGAGRHLVLVGLMGVGKSTLARALAARLGRAWRDSDEDIEVRTGRTGAALAGDPDVGVDGLHELEEAVLLDALAEPRPHVITAAGWAIESARCRDALRHCATVLWLDAPAAELRLRMATGDHRRPMTTEELAEVGARRTRLFASVADRRVDATRPPEAILAELLDTGADGGTPWLIRALGGDRR
jgi:shikimate kinase